jgi:glycosyltransferase involved in cell wall biosynthesis
LSDRYDLFVNCTHWLPSFCHAKRGALVVLFPFYIRPPQLPEMAGLPAWKRLRHRAYYDFEWRRRLGTYRTRLTISRYAREWTLRRWGIHCDVVFPPVDVDFPPGPKTPLVLSVGRFATQSHTKKQVELMQAFRELHASSLAGWTYACVGGLNDVPENRAYFERVRALGPGGYARVEANLSRAELRQRFARAKIFWHATGFGEDTQARPELAEHFGIATVEAMAAGCVPVVIDKGGQSEIVEHGTSGFLWSTLEELKGYTELLVHDTRLWQQMSAAARQRAQGFARQNFIARMSAACEVPPGHGRPRERLRLAPYWTRKSASTGR